MYDRFLRPAVWAGRFNWVPHPPLQRSVLHAVKVKRIGGRIYNEIKATEEYKSRFEAFKKRKAKENLEWILLKQVEKAEIGNRERRESKERLKRERRAPPTIITTLRRL